MDPRQTTAIYAPVELKFTSDSLGEFEGHGAVFGNVDSHGDVIVPGAFQASLAEHKARGTMPGLYLEHSAFTGGDRLPVGVWKSLEEDARGLKGVGKISALDTDYGRRVRSLMQDGALRGLSIAFGVLPGGALHGKGGNEPRRTLRAVALHAVDLVTQPSNPHARVSEVKSLASRAELEELLLESGLARGAARKIASAGWPALTGDPDAPPTPDPLAAKLADILGRTSTEMKTLKELFQ